MTARRVWTGLAFFLAACDPAATPDEPGDSGTTVAPDPEELRATIGPAGGVLEGEEGSIFAGIRLDIPPGALSEPTEITLRTGFDPVPLASTSEAIGPLVRMTPEDLVLAAPATLTVPLDPSIVAGFGLTPADCRVWQREGEGWTQLPQVQSTEDTVSVEIDDLAAASAGLNIPLRPPAPPSLCDTIPGLCAPPCTEPDGFCVEQLPAYPTPMTGQRLTRVTSSEIGYLTVSAPDTITPVRVAVGATSALTWTGLRAPSAIVRGHLTFDSAGNPWQAVRGFGSVRFARTAAPTLFDTGSATVIGPVLMIGGTANRTSFSPREPITGVTNDGTAGNTRLCPVGNANTGCTAFDLLDAGPCCRALFPSPVIRTGTTNEVLATLEYEVIPPGQLRGTDAWPVITTVTWPQTSVVSLVAPLRRVGAPEGLPGTSAPGLGVSALPSSARTALTGYHVAQSAVDQRIAVSLNDLNDLSDLEDGGPADFIYVLNDDQGTPNRPYCVLPIGLGDDHPRNVILGPVALANDGTAVAIDRASPRVFVCDADGGLQIVTLTTDAAALADWTPTDIVYIPFSDTFAIQTRGRGLIRLSRAL
jgi:hypothetical protein